MLVVLQIGAEPAYEIERSVASRKAGGLLPSRGSGSAHSGREQRRVLIPPDVAGEEERVVGRGRCP